MDPWVVFIWLGMFWKGKLQVNKFVQNRFLWRKVHPPIGTTILESSKGLGGRIVRHALHLFREILVLTHDTGIVNVYQ